MPPTQTWRCRCGGPQFVHIERGDESLLVVEGLVVAHTWRYRLRLAWKALRRGAQTWVEVVLDPDTAAEVASALRADG